MFAGFLCLKLSQPFFKHFIIVLTKYFYINILNAVLRQYSFYMLLTGVHITFIKF